MKVSELKYKIEIMKTKHEYDLKTLKMVQDMELKALLSSCIHKYDDGSSAMSWKGMQHNGYEVCEICGETL